MCEYALDDIVNILDSEVPETPFNPDDAEAFLLKVFLGLITVETLDITHYGKVVSYLMNAMINGFGGLQDDFVFGTGLGITARGLEQNIWEFSAAQQYQQVRIMTKLDIRSISFDEFVPLSRQIFKDFNKTQLKSEYVTSVLQSQNAREWVEFQENEDITMLKYNTQRDRRVRDSHARLDRITLPKNHPFWNDYMPSNGWRCRCFVTSSRSRRRTDLSKKSIPKFGTKDFPKEFKMNAGKDRVVFKSNHPYFSVSKGDKALKDNNFNLPLPPR